MVDEDRTERLARDIEADLRKLKHEIGLNLALFVVVFAILTGLVALALR